ncbi:ATP-binding protein [Candidatus Daviesbacteria bacterium]|nr:ATP-binding protein [Candidatus Daviesbacteria bacterium]
MDGLQVLETISKINPWYKNNQVPKAQLESFQRREFQKLIPDLSKLDMATMIIGGRRVGKSVLMYQLIDHLLQNGTKQENILFIQGDNPILIEYLKDKNLLNVIFDIYQKYIIKNSFSELTDTVYIFIDEAQNISKWELEVKSIIDLKYKIKFIITGSSSRELRQGAQNPLTGRIIVQTIPPFSFSDFIRYNVQSQQRESFETYIDKPSHNFKTGLAESNIELILSSAQQVVELTSHFNVKRKLDEYLYIGGFPWVLSHKDGDDIHKYLRDLLTTTISKDILTQVEIRDTQAFERLMVNLCLSSGNIIKYKNLAEVLGLDERSVIKYVDYYVESHWAFISSPYFFHRKVDSVKSGKKIYVIDSGVMNTLTFKDENDLKSDRQYRGEVLENVIHNHLLAFKQSLVGTFQNFIPYWQEEETNKEIDFIFESKNGVIPIEVKCKVNVDEDIPVLEYFLKERPSSKLSIITTEDVLQRRGNVLLMPYSILLMLL